MIAKGDGESEDKETFTQRWKSGTLDFFFWVWLYDEELNHVRGKYNVANIFIGKLKVENEGLWMLNGERWRLCIHNLLTQRYYHSSLRLNYIFQNPLSSTVFG